MTSPKQITKLAIITGTISLAGIMPMVWLRPAWGLLSWWPLLGLGLALLLLTAAYAKGAYLAGQQRAEMVDKLNDCYRGVPAGKEEPT
jgi:hypothetical protein